jgi:osmotically-inducible protein OsmY
MMTAPRFPVFFLSLILLMAIVVGCGATVSGAVDDPTITQRIKLLFLNDPVIRPQNIEVQTFKGSVTLSGRVASKQEEEKAIALARTIRGVKDVKSTLKIQPN